jgi:hypothetical protein
MAIQAHGKKPGAQINRTPAPKLDRQHGGLDYGEANAYQSVAALPSGVGGPQTILGKNLRDSVDDPVFDQILKSGVAGRDDSIPADGDLQTRVVSDQSYAPSFGMKRQQNPDALKTAKLPATTGGTSSDYAQRRNAAVKRT